MWPIILFLTALLGFFPSGIGAETEDSTPPYQNFSKACVSWNLSASRLVGEGWVLSGFCKNSEGTYCWDDTLLNNCLGTDGDGGLIHEPNGNLSGHCPQCNDNNGWGHTSSIDHLLWCNCTNAEDGLTESSLDLDTVYGYWNDSLKCLALPASRVKDRGASVGVDMARRLSARTPELTMTADNAPGNYCCFWDSCLQTITMRQPEPWLFTRCRKAHDVDASTVARFDLSQAFTYDRGDWTIKPGNGLYDDGNGCKDCQMEGSLLYCQCPQPGVNFTEKFIDLNEHISNINGTLCSSSYCGDQEGPTAPISGTW